MALWSEFAPPQAQSVFHKLIYNEKRLKFFLPVTTRSKTWVIILLIYYWMSQLNTWTSTGAPNKHLGTPVPEIYFWVLECTLTDHCPSLHVTSTYCPMFQFFEVMLLKCQLFVYMYIFMQISNLTLATLDQFTFFRSCF